tara:strand:+ start:437 stop:1057 length:621 start_codon:yes stop_codon:yes gene_type:complete
MNDNGTWLTPEDRKNYAKYFSIDSCITEEEAASLAGFAKTKVPSATNEESEISQGVELYNRPDSWDDSGVINKLQNIFRDSLKEHFFLTGILEPRKFILLRSDELQSYKEEYEEFTDNGEVSYTAFMTLNTEFRGGHNDYYVGGEGFISTPGNLHIHRNERGNSWLIKDVNVGTRFDVILVVIERPVTARYDEFEIEMSVDDGRPY